MSAVPGGARHFLPGAFGTRPSISRRMGYWIAAWWYRLRWRRQLPHPPKVWRAGVAARRAVAIPTHAMTHGVTPQLYEQRAQEAVTRLVSGSALRKRVE